MGEMDDGARCAEHMGEVFPPRCSDCDALREAPLDGADPFEVPEPLRLAG